MISRPWLMVMADLKLRKRFWVKSSHTAAGAELMKITCLGTGTPESHKRRASSGYLVEIEMTAYCWIVAVEWSPG